MSGHASWPLFEGVPWVRGIRQLGYFQSLREAMLVDPYRWRQDGWWYRTWCNRKLALNFACGVVSDKLASRYRSNSSSQVM